MYTVGDVYVNGFFLRARATPCILNIKRCVICHFEGFSKLYNTSLYWSKKHAFKKKLRHFWKFLNFQDQKKRIWLNRNRANFLICYSPKFSLCHGILSSTSFCTGFIVKNAFECARPHALPLKIKPLEKYRFSNLVQMDRIIYHSTQNHESNPTVYRS